MRVPTQQRSFGTAFNITPLIDLVFLLNIFFLVATYFIRNDQVETVDLPSATQGQDESEDAPGQLVVTVNADGQMSLKGAPLTLEEFESALRETLAQHGIDQTEVRVRADKAALYSTVEPLLLKTAELGVVKFRFAVLQSQD
jgi:biopolymer transport protein ExbD